MPEISHADMLKLKLRHKTPCDECPWRKCHLPGWLGGYTAEQFIGSTTHDVPVPCHKTLVEGARPALCAGALIFMKNGFKMPVREQLVKARGLVEADRENVFSFPQEFLDHHAQDPTEWLKARMRADNCTEEECDG